MSIAIESGRQDYLEYICLHRNEYYRLAYSFMGNEADSLDAVSQMTIVVIEKQHTLRKAEAFPSWSKKILVNICRDKLKEKKRVQPLELPLEQAAEDPPNIEDELIIRQALNELSPKYREALILRYYLGYAYKEIALCLQVPEGTIKSRLNRGLASLKEQLKGVRHE